MHPSPAPRGRLLLLGSMLALAGAAAPTAGCDGTARDGGDPRDPARPTAEEIRPETVVLTVDGLEITSGEIHAFDEFVRQFDPAAGRDALARMVLTTHVLPLRASKREYGDRWEAARERAAALADRCRGDGYPRLAELGPLHDGTEARRKTRGGLELPIARWVFAKENLYAVSPPLEVASGFHVAAAFDYHDELSTGLDMVDLYSVAFPVVDPSEYNTWWAEERARLATRCTWVHPEYRNCLPKWLAAPP